MDGIPSHLILNPPYNPGCPNYFGYGTLEIDSRINDGSISAPAVGYLTHTPGYRFSTTVELVESSTVNEIEVVLRGLMNPSGAYIKAFIYDGSWQQVGSVNPYSIWGDAIANAPRTFEFTSGAPWNNVTRVRAETYGNYIPSPFGGYCVQAYIYELRAFGPACVPNDYSACYDNDRYWYNSCDVRDGLREDCGSDGWGLWSANYCSNNDVYHSHDYHDRGCAADTCFDNITSTEEELVQDCGLDGVDLWGANYCSLDDIYHSRTVHDRGCASAACFDNTSTEEELVQDCGVGCVCTAVVACNCPPVANADGPYVISLPSTVVGLDGSGSVDVEDCPGGGIGCPMVYGWVIVNDPVSGADCELVAGGVQPSITCTSEGSADVTLTVTDSGGLQTSDNTTITVNAAPNTPPVADADGPYVITLPSTVVGLDGSGSVDVEDCPGGGIGCPMIYDWVIVNDSVNSAGCELVAGGVQPSITCTSEGSADVTLTVTDSDGSQNANNTTITVNYAPGGGPEFNIVSLEFVPNPVTINNPVSVDALVEVVNLGGGPENCEVDISMKDLSGNSKPTDAVPLTQSVGSSPVLFTIPFTVDSGWQPGNYAVTATASKVAAAESDSQRTAYLSVLLEPRQAVPEMMPSLAVFVAFAVLLVIGLKGRPEKL